MKITEYIGSQFGNPRGIIGKICCLIMNTINREMYRKVVNAIDRDCSMNVLDIGFGNGYLVQKLFQKSKGLIYGIDISEDMLAGALKRNVKGIKEGRIKLSLGDCCDLKFEDDTFDVISSVNTIYFWPDTLTGLQEINRVLKKGGVFYNVVYSKEWLKKLSYTKKGFKLFEKSDYKLLGEEAGFTKIYIEEIISGKSYFIKWVK